MTWDASDTDTRPRFHNNLSRKFHISDTSQTYKSWFQPNCSSVEELGRPRCGVMLVQAWDSSRISVCNHLQRASIPPQVYFGIRDHRLSVLISSSYFSVFYILHFVFLDLSACNQFLPKQCRNQLCELFFISLYLIFHCGLGLSATSTLIELKPYPPHKFILKSSR